MSKETEQNWINDEIFRAWINRTSAPNKITIYDQLAKEAFIDLLLSQDDCGDCPHFFAKDDKYCTGDSPAELLCFGTQKECPRQDDIGDLIAEKIRYKLNELSDSDLSPLVEALKERNQFSQASLFVKILMG